MHLVVMMMIMMTMMIMMMITMMIVITTTTTTIKMPIVDQVLIFKVGPGMKDLKSQPFTPLNGVGAIGYGSVIGVCLKRMQVKSSLVCVRWCQRYPQR